MVEMSHLLKFIILCMIYAIKSQSDDSLTEILDITNFDSENPPPTPVLIEAKNISKAKSFCVRYYVESIKNQGIFTTPSGDIGFMLFTNQKLGFIEFQRKYLIYPLPDKKPYEYEHFCFSRNDTSYLVVSEGNLIYSSELPKDDIIELIQPLQDTKISIGPVSFESSSVEKYFKGKISELYLFENSFSLSELQAISSSCSKISSGVKLFDWSRLKPSDFDLPTGYSIGFESDQVQDVCSTKKRNQIALLPFPQTIEGKNLHTILMLQ